MGTLPRNAVQQKVYDLLVADTGAGGASTLVGARIYDVPVDNPAYPYIKIGDDAFRDWGSHTHSGFEADLTVHVWSQKPGTKETNTILSRIYELLHNIDLAITGFPTVVFRCELNEVVPNADDRRTHHGVQRYRLQLGGNNG